MIIQELDILAFAAHPDDVELGCSGTLYKHVLKGYKVGIIDLTRGELGTRGSVELRNKEAEASSKVLGVSVRENLDFADGFFQNDKTHQLEIIKVIRKYRPKIVLANSISDRHIDHGRAAALVADAAFLSGLAKIETHIDGKAQQAWRPQAVYHYIQDYYLKPDFAVDITETFDKKIESILCFSSQFYNPKSNEPETPISSKDFLNFVEARAREFGRPIQAKFAEGFKTARYVGVNDLFDLK
jgi:bacillithiol biosynthesis deacetylase BshB1